MTRRITFKAVFLLFMVVYAITGLMASAPAACARAAHNVLDFCYVTTITVENTGAVDMTDQPVRVLLPITSMTGGDQLDVRGWDAYPVIGAANNEIEMFGQSLASSQAPFWFNVPDLPAGTSRDIQLYTGSDHLHRENGIRFTGVERITTTDHADLDITDNLDIEIQITNYSDTARGQWIVDKSDGTNGYGVLFADNGSLELQFAVDTGRCALTWNSAWTNTSQRFRFEYIAAAGIDATIYRNEVAAVTCDLDVGAIATNAENLGVGNYQLTDAAIHTVEILESGVRAVHYGYAANRTNETSSTLPYTGTTEDYSGNGHTATYQINSDQSDISFSIGVIAPNQFVQRTTIGQDNSILGGAVTGNFATPRPTVASGIVYDNVIVPLENVATATGAPPEGVIAAFAYGVSLALAVIVWLKTRYTPLAALTLGVGPTIAVVMGFIPEWNLLLWGFAVIVVWFAQLRSDQA